MPASSGPQRLAVPCPCARDRPRLRLTSRHTLHASRSPPSPSSPPAGTVCVGSAASCAADAPFLFSTVSSRRHSIS